MAGSKGETPEKEPEQDEGKEVVADKDLGHISNWEFLRIPPTTERVLDLLRKLPDVWGEKAIDYADFIQPLPANKKIKVPHKTNPNIMVDEYIDNWTLYMSVAGRAAMLNAAAERLGWRVMIEPEPNSPVGAPGFISLEQRIVYREYIRIFDKEGKELGVRNGMAWVPFSGGSQAAGSNPYEKVETSARGRAIAAWGFGVLPGSGVASLEEMLGVDSNREAMKAEKAYDEPSGANKNRPSRDDLLEEAFGAVEALRMTTGDDDKGMVAKVGKYVSTSLGARGVWDESEGIIHWDLLKDGQLMMLTKFLQQKNAEIMGSQL